jgi:transposase
MDDAGLIDKEDLGSAHTRAREVHGEVLTGPERRRRWGLEEKLRILAQSVAPGSSAWATAPIDRAPRLAEPDRPTDGTIEVELPSGVKLHLIGAVDAVALRRVLSALS